LFQVKLSEITPFSQTHFSGADRWIGIQVGAGAEMSPRTKISSVGYAMQALETDPTWEGDLGPIGSIGRTGFVGIGTLSPQAPLEVASTGIPHIRLTNVSAGGDYVQKITFWKNETEKFAIGYDLWGEGDDLFTLYDTNLHGPVFNIKNGRVGINTTNPTALLHTEGTGTGEGNVVFVGEYKSTSPGAPPVSGAGTRMMWYSDKAAFRAGRVSLNQWDQGNVGNYSFATGFETTASGNLSTAMGYFSTASGYYSIAMGRSSLASGVNSTAIGDGATASSLTSVAVGSYNIGGGNPSTWVATDPIFEIGIGTSGSDKRNALTVLKNGNVGIGTIDPVYRLEVKSHTNGSYGIAGFYDSDDRPKVIIRQSGEAGFSYGAIHVYDATTPETTVLISGYGNNYFNNAGNFGIGATNPGYKLTVYGTAYCSAGAWTGSDIRWKKDISPMNQVLPLVMELKAVNYFLRTEEFPEMGFSTDPQIGLIAQEVEKIFPQLVSTDPNGFKSIAYDKLSVLLLEALKEQQAEIGELNSRFERLERTLENLVEK
jgi:hypothetical protein